MARKKSFLYLLPLSLALSFGLAATSSFPTLVQAQISQPDANAQGQGVGGNWNAFNPPSTGLPGGRQEGGGVRGPCPNGSEQITALSPQTNAGLTASALPKFYLYVPATISLPMEFTLSEFTDANNEENEKEVYQTTFKLTGTPGVISVSMPEGEPPLEVGKNYYWSFSLLCQNNAPEASIIRGGWIKRSELSPKLQQELNSAKAIDRPSIYAREAIWFDTVSSLAELRRLEPDDATVAKNWEELLNSVELGNLANAPFVDTTQP